MKTTKQGGIDIAIIMKSDVVSGFGAVHTKTSLRLRKKYNYILSNFKNDKKGVSANMKNIH